MLCLRWVLCGLFLAVRVLSHPGVSDLHKGVNAEAGTGHANFGMLYIMDPNGRKCFEEVSIDAFTSENLLSWVRNLRDELTRTEEKPEGDYLKVRGEVS